MTVDCYSIYPPEEWATGYCKVGVETEDGEWGGIRLHYGEEYDGEGHPDEQFASSAGVAGIEGMAKTTPWAREYRDAAIDLVEMARTAKSIKRVVIGGCVRAVVRERRGEVWVVRGRG